MIGWLSVIFLAIQSLVLSLVNTHVPNDYMDEIFHGPQAREYCRGAFTSWHPKITTFPGLYYLATLYGWVRWAVQLLVMPVTMAAACATPFLRSLNILLSVACLLTLHATLIEQRKRSRKFEPKKQQQQPQPQQRRNLQQQSTASATDCPPLLHALTLALYPLHWFFSFLFYTDVASLLFLLLARLAALRQRYWAAALAGAVAVLCRQTNAVWAAFLFGEAFLSELELVELPTGVRQRATHGSVVDSPMTSSSPATSPTRVTRRRRTNDVSKTPLASLAADEVAEAAVSFGNEGDLFSELKAVLAAAWHRRRQLSAALWPLLLPPAGFIVFLVANHGSVVLGDKDAHQPVRHGAQLLYFAGWVAAMLLPQLLGPLMRLGRAAVRRPLIAVAVAAATVAAAAAVGAASTLVHPYLLADNRHYVFYLWRRLLGRQGAVKLALAPAYAAAWAALIAGLRAGRVSRLWIAGFLACLVAQLLPAWLLELRYFTPGFYLIALQLPPPGRLQSVALLTMYTAINAATMYLFLYRPYTFADGSAARFMW